MDNTTYCVLNGPRMFPLEKILRTFAKSDGSYVISVFDCCREKMSTNGTRGLQADNIDDRDFTMGATRGGGGGVENIIMTFGCRPSAGVPIKSTIAKNYFKYLRMSAKEVAETD